MTRRPPLGFLEVHAENYMGGGLPVAQLAALRRDYPIALHGVGLSVGSAGPLDRRHLARLRELIEHIEPCFVSEHLSWSVTRGAYLNHLLPLPYTEEALAVVVDHVGRVQDRLGRRILVENVSSYVAFRHSTMPEWEFLSAVAERADCGILLDVNNVWVSARNHGFSPEAYVDALPPARIGQFHLAGHQDHGTHLLDTHDHPVPEAVWGLYRHAVARFGPVSSLVEWDDHVPALDRLLAEAELARTAEAEVLGVRARSA
jgi:uncharacterized protein (UPF0276 family)